MLFWTKCTKLSGEQKLNFGTMTPQHMIEHLSLFVRFSNGNEPQTSYYTSEEESLVKEMVIKKKIYAKRL
ncbi:hypothetical protein [Chryseobacterium sp.]|uniref:hypothetical protein n=1 Tax=Chryseobacterium sp. TaxID=1871047 RepID=UPI0031D8A1E3